MCRRLISFDTLRAGGWGDSSSAIQLRGLSSRCAFPSDHRRKSCQIAFQKGLVGSLWPMSSRPEYKGVHCIIEPHQSSVRKLRIPSQLCATQCPVCRVLETSVERWDSGQLLNALSNVIQGAFHSKTSFWKRKHVLRAEDIQVHLSGFCKLNHDL